MGEGALIEFAGTKEGFVKKDLWGKRRLLTPIKNGKYCEKGGGGRGGLLYEGEGGPKAV